MPRYVRKREVEIEAEQWFPGDPEQNKRLCIKEYIRLNGQPAGKLVINSVSYGVVPGDYVVTSDESGQTVVLPETEFESLYCPATEFESSYWSE